MSFHPYQSQEDWVITEYLQNGKYFDVCVQIFGSTYRLHKASLSRSPFFSISLESLSSLKTEYNLQQREKEKEEEEEDSYVCIKHSDIISLDEEQHHERKNHNSEIFVPPDYRRSAYIFDSPEDLENGIFYNFYLGDDRINQQSFEVMLRRLYGFPDLISEAQQGVSMFATAAYFDLEDLADYLLGNIPSPIVYLDLPQRYSFLLNTQICDTLPLSEKYTKKWLKRANIICWFDPEVEKEFLGRYRGNLSNYLEMIDTRLRKGMLLSFGAGFTKKEENQLVRNILNGKDVPGGALNRRLYNHSNESKVNLDDGYSSSDESNNSSSCFDADIEYGDDSDTSNYYDDEDEDEDEDEESYDSDTENELDYANGIYHDFQNGSTSELSVQDVTLCAFCSATLCAIFAIVYSMAF